MRADLADARLADRIFAPHYALPVRRIVTRAVALRDTRGAGGTDMVALDAGAAFDLLDVTGGIGWGIAVADGLVGYVDADALAATA
ncbi:hypothetical protein ASG29_13940 [Sphingomonas sp. Leaf412]|uniref:hypothetical protein n=1 Tax=Sphingomonas sp. Leaf412 TaxID=1736370 RepID=UPI0006F62801|nr:hypothetical protein [Sphingomonas sp. Leaf412]KQT32796.1 hypothetical protein ASG29_13940 [Sphingomonas sp. Leaf412]